MTSVTWLWVEVIKQNVYTSTLYTIKPTGWRVRPTTGADDNMEIFGVAVPIWVIFLLVAILLYAFMMSRDFLTFRRMGVPGPLPLPIVGNLISLLYQGTRAFDLEAIKKYGKVYGHFDGLSSNLVVADKEMLREILVKQFNNFQDRVTFGEYSGDLKHGLLEVKGDHWRQNRNTITPTFSSGKLRQMMPLIQEACDTLLKTTRKLIKNGGDGNIEVRRLFGGYTTDVISSTAFGIHVDSQNNPDDPFVKHASKMFDVSFSTPLIMMMMFFPALKPLLLKLGVRVYDADSMAYFRKLTSKLLDERRRNKEEGRMDFLQLMIDAQDGRLEADDEDEESKEKIDNSSKQKYRGLTFDEILGNAELFFAAGYETTALTLTMNAYNLATNPECQDKLRKEIKDKIGSEIIDSENIKKLQYIDMCITETLRMYTPAVRIDRVCVKTAKVKDITIPEGMAITIPVYAIHRDPEIWEKPDVFRPERFSPSEKMNHDPLDYLPFGYGPRSCIGMRLALLEAKIATAQIVRNFKLCVCSKTDIPPKLEDEILLKPRYMWLKMEEIK